ncbi:diguanylate cyclase (GGDEF) domain-containing protein [Amycolatopsis sacchari]|uniref:Diguanylate cyclase (GGDEF) domain-containing protein n=1 Tax=Amycolatopsis sacchari TaxID=115433 RepID=A0A1I3T7B7_9PSEU|nr:GGDEF domain-containing protein [Amycolatopsis sacchari]SFJ66382.1 diguanylate cyclase (GGDEF) domain-containing protein [Amycolatopsis sacchari]
MRESSRSVRFAFQPLYSLHTGGVVALEALARPGRGSVAELLDRARREQRLPEVDVALAAEAARAEADHETLLPLHLNLTATTAAAPGAVFDPLLDALASVNRRPREVVLEIGPPFAQVWPEQLLAGLHRLAELGFRLALDGLGRADLPFALLAAAPADLLKLDRTVLGGLPADPASVAVVESLLHYAARSGTRLVATGIETEAQLTAVRKLGVRIAQGNLFAPAADGVSWTHLLTPATPEPGELPGPGPLTAPRVRDFLRPASTLPADATCDDVRTALAAGDGPSGIVGVDEHHRPQWSVDRTRFLVSVTGPYGHALHAKRPAARLADPPHVISADAGALELLELVTDADWSRTGDDVVVVDERGRCVGVVLVTEVVRGVAEAKVEEAAALNPLTRLPGSDTVARDIERRIACREPFVTAWLDVDSFKAVNDNAGFAAGDDLIRALGRTLTDLAARLKRTTVSHVGGDDFLIACDVDEIGTIAAALLDTPWSADGLPVTVSLATLVCATATISSYREASRRLAPLKKRAKAVPGSSWVLGRPDTEHVEILRGRRLFPEQRAPLGHSA